MIGLASGPIGKRGFFGSGSTVGTPSRTHCAQRTAPVLEVGRTVRIGIVSDRHVAGLACGCANTVLMGGEHAPLLLAGGLE